MNSFNSPLRLLILWNFPDQESPDTVRELIKKTRSLTDKPFGVGVVLAFPHKENIKAILAEKVAFLQISWGEVREDLVAEAHRAEVKVVPQVSLFTLFNFVDYNFQTADWARIYMNIIVVIICISTLSIQYIKVY